MADGIPLCDALFLLPDSFVYLVKMRFSLVIIYSDIEVCDFKHLQVIDFRKPEQPKWQSMNNLYDRSDDGCVKVWAIKEFTLFLCYLNLR